MAQDGEEFHVPPPPMPKEIAIAIIEVIKEIKSAAPTGEGKEGMRVFKYASINDVLDAAHDVLNSKGLAVAPIEVSYAEEIVPRGPGTAPQKWARYGYRFRLIHETGSTWVDEADTRHISIAINESGMSAGKAQSLALRDYLKGLLRIRTAEPEIEDAAPESGEPKPEITVRLGEPKGPATMPFIFGPEDGKMGGMKPYTAAQVKELFDKIVAPLSKAKRAEWEETNAQGLKQLHELSRKIAIQIRRELDRE